MKILDIGCGKNKHDGAIGLDHHKVEGVDIVHDLEKKMPFDDNEFDLVYCSQVLEHIHGFIQLMEEIHRICKNGAKIIINVPFYSHECAYGNPTHVRYFTLNSFEYFTPENNENYISKARFKIVKKRIIWSTSPRSYMKLLNKIFTPFVNIFPRLYSYYLCYLFPSEELYFELETIKDDKK